ncbi:hypothetical protein SEVIR_7G320000v4 [Setaria viridis]|uniref:VQ domain-containing protein n=2 Tax=Setaria TaxID=4554 RepID=A0A368S1W4_SETIT|nr:predicted GPI-anchored protein 58 [Setaria italica]RCV36324.1 hypothetical protein SETIT_7G309400v2 [Setaria italica]TKW07638.1 hypothetical protein SEVIR_7G320000v2 [Setaria viridis]
MLMTAAVHMDSAARGLGPSPSPSASAPPPWLPVLADDNNRHRQLLRDFAPTPTPATAAPPNHHQNLRPAGTRRVAKRRPRPSRKLPTTYIAANPASFRRMVHQVTGADDLPMPPPPAPPETLCRPAPYRSGTASGAMMLPTLDTSAFLLAAPGAAARTDAPCAGPAAPAPAPAVDRTEAGGASNYSSNSNSGSS